MMRITADDVIRWGYKRHGKKRCSSCGAVHDEFIKQVGPGDLKGCSLQATCICGWTLHRWTETSRVDYFYLWIETKNGKKPTTSAD